MTRKTESEVWFEALCDAAGIKFEPIPREEGEQTPDYMLTLSGQQVVAEVKQFDPNREESRKNAAFERGEIVVQGGKPGQRIRAAIDSAAPQLKRRSEGRLPAVLVVYNFSGVSNHTDPYSVATAMQGFDVIDVHVPEEMTEPPQFGAPRSGPKKRMTATDNTTISAVAVLGHNLDGSLRLDVFHNTHAKNRLDPGLMRAAQVRHWRRPAENRSSLEPWQPFDAGDEHC